MEKSNIEILVERTPNPESLKFSLPHTIAEENFEASDIPSAGRSPLAQKILGFPWATKVFIGSHFITITKENWVEWDIIQEPLGNLIKEHIEGGGVVLAKPMSPEVSTTRKAAGDVASPPGELAGAGQAEEKAGVDTDIIRKIKELLERDIQPAVAMDGGFIAFAGFENGTVFLKMQGACSGCPSSQITLKQGVENHLKNHLPAVREVVAL